MKTSRFSITLTVLFLFSILLSSCAGGSTTPSSWPGLTVDGNKGYLAYSTHVYAVNLDTGAQIWRFPEKASNQMTFYAPPAVVDENQLLVGSYNKVLYSLAAQTGQEIQNPWPFTGAKNHYIAKPLVVDGKIFAPCADGNLYALDKEAKVLWTFKTGHGLWSTPIMDGETLYLAAMDHHLYAINASDGSLTWKSEALNGALVGSPTLSPDGVLYIGTLGSEMVAVDSASGKVLWRVPTAGWVWSGPALEGDTLYFGDQEGHVYALEAADGSIIWDVQPETATARSISDRPLVLDGTVYYSSESGTLFALEAANGSQRWNRLVGGKLVASPVGVGDTILVTPMGIDALLVAFDANGNQKWTPFVPQK